MAWPTAGGHTDDVVPPRPHRRDRGRRGGAGPPRQRAAVSGFRTHMLVGAAGGVVLARFLTLHPTLAGRDGTAEIPLAGHPGALRGVLALAGLVAGSAVLATWSDIDEPGSWIARRARTALTLLGAVLGAAAGWAAGARRLAPGVPLGVELAALTGLALGAAVGAGAGRPLLLALRHTAGGHRRLTHSLVLAGGLLALAVAVALLGAPEWAIVPAALAWGLALHDLGDVVTPAGLPLLWPLREGPVRLPRAVARHGEKLAAGVAVLVIIWAVLAPPPG
jgi:membrane-bound metal-dependent hydrolase YbcI (DUF457 family)